MKIMLLTFLLIGLLAAGFGQEANATLFTSSTDLSMINFGAYRPGMISDNTGTKTWTNAMPSDFQMPYDTINSARLTITSSNNYANLQNVFVESTFVGTLTPESGWFWIGTGLVNPNEISTFNITTAFAAPWAQDSALNVSISYSPDNNIFTSNFFFLYNSTLTLDYSNKVAPVPEPGTITMIGIGTLCLVVYGKRRNERTS